jgi:hypothetical protein
MKKILLAIAFIAFIGTSASLAQTTSTKEEVKVEGTTKKSCSGSTTKTCSGSTVNAGGTKSCCSSGTKTSCSGQTTMTSTDAGKTGDSLTTDDKGSKKNKKSKKQCNGTSSNGAKKPCCSGH